jgi:predicted DNA-binding transcriptional regulator YafY
VNAEAGQARPGRRGEEGLAEIVWWGLGYGPEAVVLSAAKLRNRLTKTARRMLEAYEKA